MRTYLQLELNRDHVIFKHYVPVLFLLGLQIVLAGRSVTLPTLELDALGWEQLKIGLGVQ